MKETTQIGAELMGDASVEADGEMIAMLVDALLKTGLKQFQVSVGEIDYFKGICEDLSLTAEQEKVIRDYISNKNFFAVKEYLQSENISEEQINVIMAIEDVFDAVSERRCYRDAMPMDKCFSIIEEGSGQDFDPILADVFLDIRDKVEEIHKEFNQ